MEQTSEFWFWWAVIYTSLTFIPVLIIGWLIILSIRNYRKIRKSGNLYGGNNSHTDNSTRDNKHPVSKGIREPGSGLQDTTTPPSFSDPDTTRESGPDSEQQPSGTKTGGIPPGVGS